MNLLFLLQAQQIPADSIKEPAQILDHTIRTVLQTPVDELVSTGIKYSISFGIKVLGAIVIYSLGAWFIKKTRKILQRIFLRRKMDASLSSFLISFVNITFTVILLVTTISILGVDTTSFVAILAGSGLAIGMALSGTLQNFAGGIMILMFKPFKVGDFIEAQGVMGKVISIEITTTHVYTPDHKIVVLPNGALSNGTIYNYSATGIRRCDWNISISYGDDIDKAKQVITDILKANPLVINNPEEPFVALSNLADSSLIVTARAWVNSGDYWTLFFQINETIYNELPKHGINFPFPQMDVHITKEN